MLEVRSLLEEFTSASQGEERLLDNLTPQQRREHVDSPPCAKLQAAIAAEGVPGTESRRGIGRRPNCCASRR